MPHELLSPLLASQLSNAESTQVTGEAEADPITAEAASPLPTQPENDSLGSELDRPDRVQHEAVTHPTSTIVPSSNVLNETDATAPSQTQTSVDTELFDDETVSQSQRVIQDIQETHDTQDTQDIQDTQVTQEPASQVSERIFSTPKKRKVRLSTTSDGIAKILGPDDISPSPPRSQPIEDLPPIVINRSLRRSYSTAGLSDLGASFSSTSSLRRVPSGRSRDSRAWEFWCDSEARNELALKADQEQTGSAAAAISLMRSSSRGRKALAPLPHEANRDLRQSAVVLAAKRQKTDHPSRERPETARSVSLVDKLQDGLKLAASKLGMKTSKTRSRVGNANFVAADSDKENVDPEGNVITATPSSQRKSLNPRVAVLGSSQKANSQTPSADTGRRRKRGLEKASNQEDDDEMECDEEVENFMRERRSGTARSGATVGDDLDCIQGLLSLSQGNWK